MIHTTTWSPDTCGCVIEYDWDDSVPDNERVHTVKRIVKECEFHKNKVSKEKHFENVLAENQGKNKAYAKVLESGSSAVEEIEDEQGNLIKRLKKGKEFKWSFDANRNLEVELVGFTKDEKDAFASIKDSKVKIK